MKRKFALLLCLILSLTLVLTACGDKETFITALQSASEIKRFEGDIGFSFSVKGADSLSDSMRSMLASFFELSEGGTVSGTVRLKTTVNDEESAKITVLIGDKEMTDLVLTEAGLFVNLRTPLTILAGAAGTSILPAGKDYLKLDRSMLPDPKNIIAGDSAGEALSEEVSSQNMTIAFWQAVRTFSPLLESAAKDVEPEILYEKDGKYCFSLTDKNLTAFANKLGEALSQDFEKMFGEYITALKKFDSCEKLAGSMEKEKDKVLSSAAEAAEQLKSFEYKEAMEFGVNADTTLKGGNGSRVWELGLRVESKTYDFSCEFRYSVREYKEAKEISIDESKVFTQEELPGLFGGSAF